MALQTLAVVARGESKLAALKVQAASDYADAAQTLAGPAESPQDHSGQEMAVTAEIACVLTVSERAAGALLAEAHELTTGLPLTMSALQAGMTESKIASAKKLLADGTLASDVAHNLGVSVPTLCRWVPAHTR